MKLEERMFRFAGLIGCVAVASVASTSSSWVGFARGARWAVTVSENTVRPTASRCLSARWASAAASVAA